MRPAPLTAVVVAALLVAGCSGSDDDSADPGDSGDGGSTTQPGGADEGACALLRSEEVSGLFGADAVAAPPPDVAVTCLWEADDEGLPTHQLQVSLYEGGEPLDAGSYGEGAEPVEGVGDEAFVVPDGFLGTTAAARQGATSVVLTYAVLTDGSGDTAAGQADEVVDLLRLATERVEG
jgi:hypothetical protein